MAKDVAGLIDRLDSADLRVREEACCILGRLGDARAVEPLVRQLRGWEQGVRIAACNALGLLGDLRAVEPLVARLNDGDYAVREAAREGLWAIAGALDPQASSLLCRKHWTRTEKCVVHEEETKRVYYWGCRVCRSAGLLVPGAGESVAVLDRRMDVAGELSDGVFRGNWLRRVSLLDFDRVEIIDATDDEVERLCVQVMSDTDQHQTGRYRAMRCAVSPECGLSAATINMLRNAFGEVAVE